MASDIKRKDPVKGKLMQLELKLLLNYAQKQTNLIKNADQLEVVKKLTDTFQDYREEKITFNQLFEEFKSQGYDGQKPETISGDVDYGEIATFDEISSISDEDLRPYKLGYKFNGTPAHPEYFNLNIEQPDKFSKVVGKTEGKFIYECPKIAYERFVACFSTKNKDEEDGDFIIELRDRTLGLEDTEHKHFFHIRVVGEDGTLLDLLNQQIYLSTLLGISSKNNKIEVAFLETMKNDNGEIEEYNKRVLNPNEVETFKSYIRAFVEALEGDNKYIEDLEKLKNNPNIKTVPKSGCLSILLIPLLTLMGILLYML